MGSQSKIFQLIIKYFQGSFEKIEKGKKETRSIFDFKTNARNI